MGSIQPPKIELENPHQNWQKIWKYINHKSLSSNQKCLWFKIVHNIYPTNERLYRTNRRLDPNCSFCHQVENVEHRFIKCSKTQKSWKLLLELLAIVSRRKKNYENSITTPGRRSLSKTEVWFLGQYIEYIHTQYPHTDPREFAAIINRKRCNNEIP